MGWVSEFCMMTLPFLLVLLSLTVNIATKCECVWMQCPAMTWHPIRSPASLPKFWPIASLTCIELSLKMNEWKYMAAPHLLKQRSSSVSEQYPLCQSNATSTANLNSFKMNPNLRLVMWSPFDFLNDDVIKVIIANLAFSPHQILHSSLYGFV